MCATWSDYAADLRRLADTVEILEDKMPLPRSPELGIDIDIIVASDLDVLAASDSLGFAISTSRGHTRTRADVGTVHLTFSHTSPEAKAEYAAQSSYNSNLRVTT